MSIIRDPETYERFAKVVLVHGCRQVAELAYGERITGRLPADQDAVVLLDVLQARRERAVGHLAAH